MERKKWRIIPISFALKKSFKEGYGVDLFKQDFMAGLIVSLVALPLAMAFSIAVGLPPQHGLITAIVTGFFVPLLGGSRVQVSGPTAAFVVIITPIVLAHGLRGLIIITIMSGFLLILLGIARVGRYIEHVPHTVTIGFTAGIAVVIGTLALNDLLGLKIQMSPDSYLHQLLLIAKSVPTLYWPECAVGMISLITMSLVSRFLPKLPSPLIGIGIGTVSAYSLQKFGCSVSTIGNHFSYIFPDGTIGHGIPPLLPTLLQAVTSLPWPNNHEWRIFFAPACIVAALSALESLLSAVVADKMTRRKHDPDSELVGIGIGNILSGLMSGIPATGAIARTATNVHNGAKTPLAGALHALFILLYVLLLTPVLALMPMAALAALLVRVAYHMSHYQEFVQIIREGCKQDAIVLVTCFLLTVFVDMIVGVGVGIVLACISHFLSLKNPRRG